MTELPKIDTSLVIYFNAVAYLHAAYLASSSGFSDELIDVLATIPGLSINTCRHINQHSSELSLIKATKLMKVLAMKSRGTVQLIEIELSKSYLHRALRCKDSDSDSIYCLANVYLAVLYYTKGQYQTAIDHCILVIRSHDYSQCSSHVVQGELLPKIDDDIDSVLGLAVFYQQIRRAALNHQQTQHVAVFSTEMFAHHLHNRYLSITQTSTNVQLRPLGKCINDTQLLITDVLALKSVYRKFQYRPITVRNCRQETLNAAELNTSELVELLQKSAVEHLTTYRQVHARDFGSAAFVTTDFEALNAYKHGDYQRCLLLSIQMVHKQLYATRVANVCTHPMFIHMFDEDIVSLTALTMIVDPKCRGVLSNVCINQVTLSLYLMTKCQLTLRHSVMSLVQTLDYIEVAERRHPAHHTLDHLTLKMTKRKILAYIK